MEEPRQIIGLIPARKGSKGLKDKCVYPLNGIPLVQYTFNAANKAKALTRIVVTTDCPKTQRLAAKDNVELVQRPPELATDTATSQSIVLHAIETLKLRPCDIVVLLQPTSPLRAACHIDAALACMNESVDGVFSVCGPETKALKAFYQNESGFLQGVFSREAPFMRRQDLPEAYYSNGAIYAFFVQAFLDAKHGFDMPKVVPYTMTKHDSVDIDTLDDIEYAQALLRERDYAASI